MTEQKIASPAFQNALLKSARHRIMGIISFLAFFTAVIAIRILIYGSKMSPWGLVASVLLIAYELLILRMIDRCLRQKKNCPPAFGS